MEKERIDNQHMPRHTMSHVLAAAVKELFKDVKFGIGPAIDNGFYYDMDLEHVITPEDFSKIEKKMAELIALNLSMDKEVLTKEQALKLFKNQPYKIELINDLSADEIISVYHLSDKFTDLCRGPHVQNTSELRKYAFKISKVSGAYWRGDVKNKMLQRIYVDCFASVKELEEYEKMMAEAEKRDHRKLGRELKLFFISEYANGMPFYMPNGVAIRNELIKYWREIHKKAGYEEIETPTALNRKLWEYSGHWDHYQKNMYTFKVEEEDFAIKPMNCPGGMLYYKENLHSYKEFPLRVGELGKVHRHEASGTLHGLFRVRVFTQDDAHIFMLPNQIDDEIKNILNLMDEMYGVFGLSYHLELSTMPENHIGEIADWQNAENSLKSALNKIGRDYVINEGDGAFYGPKIDIHVKDAIGRTWQCGTIQLDMQLPKRFNLEYVDADGSRKEPIMIHRVIYGSLDRFMGIVIENFAGIFPVWLAPIQVRVMNIADSSVEYAKNIKNKLSEINIRADIDDRNEKIGYKIREASTQKIPYMIVVGDNERESGTITVRMRGNAELKNIKIEDFVARVQKEIKERILN